MGAESDFLEAVKHGNFEKVRQYLNTEPDVAHSKDENGISAVLLALYCGHAEVADYVAQRCVRLNFFEAAALGKTEMLEDELRRDPSLTHACSPDGFTGLALASFFGRPEAVALLLSKGSDPNAVSKNPMRVTPLHSAVAHRDAERSFAIAKLLLDHNAAVNVAQQGGWTPLHQAAAHGNQKLVQLLLDHGADTQAKSSDGRTPADMAAQNVTITTTQ